MSPMCYLSVKSIVASRHQITQDNTCTEGINLVNSLYCSGRKAPSLGFGSVLFVVFYSGREAPSLGFGSVLRVHLANVTHASCARVGILWSARQRLWRSKFFYVLCLFYSISTLSPSLHMFMQYTYTSLPLE